MAGSISIACKLPNGIVLRTGTFTEVPVSVLGGGVRMERVWQADGQSITLKGNSRPFGGEYQAPIDGGYALTHGVDLDLWTRWFEDNKDSPLVKNQMVFAHAKKDFVEGMAKDRSEIRSGMEPLQPKQDPRTKSLNSSVEPDNRKAS